MDPENNSNSSGSGDSQPEIVALNRLSENLRSMFLSPESEFFADARVVVGGGKGEIPVHRCVLAARSGFFRGLFGSRDKVVRVDMGGLGFDPVAVVLGYLYGGRLGAPPEGVCACVDEDCCHATCHPAVDFMVDCLCASFMFQVSELVELYQRNLLAVIDKIAIDEVLIILSAANRCGEACERLLKRCIVIVTESDVDIIALDKALPQHTVKQITESRSRVDHPLKSQTFPDKHAKRIHRALESDDVELVRMLLREGHTSLDEARALHFAMTYCDAKTTTELLDLGLADVNCRDPRGNTVLHVAATRKEPKIIVSLLTKGARPSDLTSDGRKALQIAKRVTRASDYYCHHHVDSLKDQGKGSSGDRLCIEILEQAERRAPLFGEASVSLAMAGDDLRMKLLYLENRVGLAKLLFPMEAKVIMDISQIDETTEFLDGLRSKRTTMDLNESPFMIKEEHLIRLKALSRTVELGKRFFPRCSEVLNKIMDTSDLSQLAYLGHDTPAERLVKKRKYIELHKVLGKAFDKDKEEIGRSTISSSSSSASIGVVSPNNAKLNINK